MEFSHITNDTIFFKAKMKRCRKCGEFMLETQYMNLRDFEEYELQRKGARICTNDIGICETCYKAEADLSWADLSWADLSWADLSWADLREADIDFSCWTLWCGSMGVKVDRKIAAQLAAHFCVLDCDDLDYKAARSAVLEFAKTSHRAAMLGLPKSGE